jgi:hypothetical protein
MNCDLSMVKPMHDEPLESNRLSKSELERYRRFLQTLPECRRTLVEKARRMVESGELLTSQSARLTAKRIVEGM